MDIYLKVTDIRAMLKNLGLREISIQLVHDETTDPENEGEIDIEFTDYMVEAVDPVNGCEYKMEFHSKIRLPDGMAANSASLLGYCIACENPINISEQSRCFQCRGLFCKEHTANLHEGHYVCDKCDKKYKKSETLKIINEFMFKERQD